MTNVTSRGTNHLNPAFLVFPCFHSLKSTGERHVAHVIPEFFLLTGENEDMAQILTLPRVQPNVKALWAFLGKIPAEEFPPIDVFVPDTEFS
jgi:hypothetical protein